MFDFSATIYGFVDGFWHNKAKLTAEAYKACVFGTMKSAGTAFLSNKLENHDEPRCPNYYLWEGEITETGKKMLAGLYFCLRGIPFIYQGQEIGMENTPISDISEVDDCSSIGQYNSAIEAGLTNEEAMYHIRRLSRDNARTPMQWDNTAYAGFSKGTPWLPINPNYKKINAHNQTTDPNSTRAFYKQLIALRKDSQYTETLVYGDFEPYLPNQKNLFAYKRVGKKTTKQKILLIAANFQNQPQEMLLPSNPKKILIDNCKDAEITENTITLKPYQLIIAEL
jgi:oligo-1,6-glucosidase